MLKRINIDIDKLNDTSGVDFELVDNEVIYKSYKFIIHKYPFWYPTFMIDTIEYIDYFNKKYNTYTKKIPFLHIHCPCSTLCSTTSWGPMDQMNDIFSEYKKYSNTYKELFHFLVLYKAEFFDDLVYKTILEYQLTLKCSRPTYH